MEQTETFLRTEQKYELTRKQAEYFQEAAQAHLLPDVYPEYDLNTIYFDTADSRMIMHCLDHPLYKEKLRMRAYGNPDVNSPVFLEIKKKFRENGQKRRIQLSYAEACRVMEEGRLDETESQISREIQYVCDQQKLLPKVFIAYHSKAYAGKDEADVRITFDTNIRYRINDLSMSCNGKEKVISGEDSVLMEVKLSERYPLWLSQILSEMHLHRESFSKYGTIYAALLLQNKKEQIHRAYRAYEEAGYPAAQKENTACLLRY